MRGSRGRGGRGSGTPLENKNGLNFGPLFLDTHMNNVVVPLSEIKFVLNENVRVDNLGDGEWWWWLWW